MSRDRASLRAGNLTIKLLKKEDHGQYECILENEIASIIARTMLIVNSKLSLFNFFLKTK